MYPPKMRLIKPFCIHSIDSGCNSFIKTTPRYIQMKTIIEAAIMCAIITLIALLFSIVLKRVTYQIAVPIIAKMNIEENTSTKEAQ